MRIAHVIKLFSLTFTLNLIMCQTINVSKYTLEDGFYVTGSETTDFPSESIISCAAKCSSIVSCSGYQIAKDQINSRRKPCTVFLKHYENKTNDENWAHYKKSVACQPNHVVTPTYVELPVGQYGPYGPSNILTNECDRSEWATTNVINVWAPLISGSGTQGFIFDIGCIVDIYGFLIKNSHNGHHNDRSTENFEVLVSQDSQSWTSVLSGTLPNVLGQGCNVDVITYPISPMAAARYAKFVILSHYHNPIGIDWGTGALQYFNVLY